MKTNKKLDIDFFKTWSDDMAYILGFWFADGCIYTINNRHCFQIASSDLEILEKIKKIMKSEYAISRKKDKREEKNDWKKAYAISINRKSIYDDIVKLGGCERKSLVMTFPYVPDEFVNHFIRGFFDGNGGISLKYRNNPQITFYGTEKFLSVLSKYLPHQHKIVPMKSIYYMWYSGKIAQDILKYMYNGSKLYLDRKYELYKKGMLWIPKYRSKKGNNMQRLTVSFPKDVSKKLHNEKKESGDTINSIVNRSVGNFIINHIDLLTGDLTDIG